MGTGAPGTGRVRRPDREQSRQLRARRARRWWRPARCWASAVPYQTAAALAQLDDPMAALEEAVAVGLLRAVDKIDIRDVIFPHPLVQAAVYENVAPTCRARLHRAAAELLDDDGAALRHRGRRRVRPGSGAGRTPRRLRPAADRLGRLGQRSIRADGGQPVQPGPGAARTAVVARHRRDRQRRRPPAGIRLHPRRRLVRARPAT